MKEDCLEFEINLGYIVSSRQAWATELRSVFKNKQPGVAMHASNHSTEDEEAEESRVESHSQLYRKPVTESV